MDFLTDLVFLTIFIGLPVITYAVTRSATRAVLGAGLVLIVTGGLVELTMVFGFTWQLRSLQLLLAGGFIVMTLISWRFAATRRKPNLKRQLLGLWLPVAALGIAILIMRLLADTPTGLLAGVSYLVNHAEAEDNAKWLQLSSLIAQDRPLSFVGGYSGGPLIMLMLAVSTGLRLLSSLLLGGVNEVAVVVGTVNATSALLVILAPLALAPFVEYRLRDSRRGEGPIAIPIIGIWAGALLLAAASGALTTYGHLSVQFLLPMLVLWVAIFLIPVRQHRIRAMSLLLVVGAGVVWFPLMPVGLLAMIGLVLWALFNAASRLRERLRPDIPLIGIALLAVVAGWDGLLSPLVWILGIGAAAPDISAVGAAGAVTASLAPTSNTFTLFASPGGTEMVTPILSVLALTSVLVTVVLLSRLRAMRPLLTSIAPILLLAAFALFIAVADAVITGQGNNYATLKVLFTVTIVITVACLPIAFTGLAAWLPQAKQLQWVTLVGIAFLLTVDGLLPRAVALFSPAMWEAPDDPLLAYASSFEVQQQANQSVTSLPIACVFLPPDAAFPSGQPQGQLAYNCTRMAIGLQGAEGRVGGLTNWLLDDWVNNGAYWDRWYGGITNSYPENLDRDVLLLDGNAQPSGTTTLRALLEQFPVSP